MKGSGSGSGSKGKAPGKSEMTPQGESAPWVQSQANQERIFNLFLVAATITDAALRARAGTTFDGMPEDVACSQPIYAWFATYLTYTYVIAKATSSADIDKSVHLHHSTALGIWSGIINMAKVKWSTPGMVQDGLLLVCPRPRPAMPRHNAAHSMPSLTRARCVRRRHFSTASRGIQLQPRFGIAASDQRWSAPYSSGRRAPAPRPRPLPTCLPLRRADPVLSTSADHRWPLPHTDAQRPEGGQRGVANLLLARLRSDACVFMCQLHRGVCSTSRCHHLVDVRGSRRRGVCLAP